MKTSFKLIVFILLILVAVTFGLLIYPIIKTSRPQWPRIEDPKALLIQSQGLLGHVDSQGITPEEWPEAIKAIMPKYVHVYDDSVVLTISTGGINPSWGYLIFPDGRTDDICAPSGIKILEMSYPGIFRFETIE